MATKKPKRTTPSASQDTYASSLGRYFGGVGPAPTPPPAPKSTIKTAPINTIGSPEYEREQNRLAMIKSKSRDLPALSNPDVIESKGSIATDAAEAAAAVAAATLAQKQSLQAIQDSPEFKALVQKFKGRGMDDFPDLYLEAAKDNPKADSDTILDLLRKDKKYNFDAQGNPKGYAKRFSGNAALVKAGKIPMDDDKYLQAEVEYEKTFKKYNLPKTMFNQASYAKLIGNQISADEATERIQLGYSNLEGNTKATEAFQKFFPTLLKGDIVAAMLDETEQLPALIRKVDAAKIGGAALRQNLETSAARAEQLRSIGVTTTEAETGYGNIAGYLTDAQRLARIGKEEEFTQLTAEQSQLEGLASAKRKEKQLEEKEINRFSMQVGASRGAFSRNTTF